MEIIVREMPSFLLLGRCYPPLGPKPLITKTFGQFEFWTNPCPKFELSEIFKSEIRVSKIFNRPNFSIFSFSHFFLFLHFFIFNEQTKPYAEL